MLRQTNSQAPPFVPITSPTAAAVIVSSSSSAAASSEIAVGRACVIGGGAFGTALATVLARKGAAVTVWIRDAERAAEINASRRNSKYLPDFRLEDSITFVTDVAEAVRGAELLLLALPTPFLRAFLVANRSTFPVGVPIVLCAKGIEVASLQTPFDIVRDELPGKYTKYITVLAGPSFAKEIMQGQPTNVTVAADDAALTMEVVRKLSARVASFRCYASTDVMGCEVAGAVKNVLAIASGACHGFKLGNNARAALLCRGLVEMKRLAVALGSSGECLSGLAGVGDVMLTCSSEMSRNFSAGMRLAASASAPPSPPSPSSPTTTTPTAMEKGSSIIDFESGSGGKGVAEGVPTAMAIEQLAHRLGVEMPICHEVYMALYEGKPVVEAIKALQDRPLRSEH